MAACLRILSVAALSLGVMSGIARAQATAGLDGRVTDESGGVLPGVTVTASQTDTGFTRTVVTDETGAWIMSTLPTGPYRLEVSLQGFRTYVQTGIVLQVGATPTINAVLAVGSLEETVSVEAGTPIVDVRSAGISEVVEQERIVELPLQGRQVTDLIVLAGGALEMGRPNTKNFQGGVSISVAGGSLSGVAYVLDGAMHNDVSNDGGLPLPFPDALQEFRVATSGLSAENGMHAGAAVTAVTKSGTNALHGNVFEFLRDHRLNATHPFAVRGADGRRVDDGLRRNQAGGTFGGPIVRDRLFFFGGYQGTFTRVRPTAGIAYVPTPAMLAGDFTAIASPACNGGQQVTLRGGFVNNRIDPAQFSPAALRLASYLPKTDDPCGETRFGLPEHRDDHQAVGRLDYQVDANQSIFGRYIATRHRGLSSFSQSGGNVLATIIPNIDNLAQSLTLGHTSVVGANTVNELRFAFNRTAVDRYNDDYFGPSDLGVKVYNYSPTREMFVNVTGGFIVSENQATRGIADNNAFQMSEELTLVRGRHQVALGGNVAYWRVQQRSWASGGGTFVFNGQIAGMGLADLLLGRAASFSHASSLGQTFHQWYQGIYAQDAWRATDRITLNAGLRWEPFFGQQFTDGAIANFDIDKFRRGVKSTVYVNAPAGMVYPGDEGFPSGRSGFEARLWNFAPRAGLAWDVSGDGRTAVRASYGIAYDFPAGETWFILAASPPYGNRAQFQDPPGRFDDPYAHVGGDPSPILTSRDTRFPFFGTLGAVDPAINAPRVQQWNATLERQLGSEWGVSVSYLGSHSDRFWGLLALNPGVFLGTDPCTINGIAYPVCSSLANLNNRRALYLENPREAQYISSLEMYDDLSTMEYRGLKLSVQRRAVRGVNLNGNWTWGRCVGLPLARGAAGGSDRGGGGPYGNPADLDYDRGHCDWDRTHLANVTIGYQSPRLTGPMLGPLASNWQVSGILNARSGDWLTVNTGVTAFNGIATANRVNQVSDDVYGEKTLNSYLNRAAFAVPDPGAFGNHRRNSISGPGFWKVDLAVSRLFSFATAQRLELRWEAFNLFNNFNWGNPVTTFNAANFGRIQTMAGDARIMQLGIKYGF